MTESYDPLLYALVHQGNPGDVAFYLEACEGARRVLELGCGFGRLSLPLAEAGADVWGIDLHDGLLALAETRRKGLDEGVAARVHLQHGDMRALPLSGPFDRVVIPFSGLYCLDSDEEVLACLRECRRVLADDGALIFDGYAADAFHEECAPEDYADDTLEEVALIAARGVAYDVFERSSWNRAEQRMVVTYVHVPDGGGTPVEHAIHQRYLLSTQLSSLLAAAGFTTTHMWGSFAREPFAAESDFVIVHASPA